ncbi:MAG: hypothetical protein IKK17_04695 [Oscillospiraceae bacterium]|nr:hypothetical protein [Oscillospiraceae bacterium]
MTENSSHKAFHRLDGFDGAMALIDILYDMDAINKATYENIKRNAKRNSDKKGI